MTTDPNGERGVETDALLSDDVLASRDRLAQHRAAAAGALHRGRARRRFLPQIVAATAVVATLGMADRFVQGAAAGTATPAPTTAGATSPATAQALAQVARTLAADQRAIAALARNQAQLAGDGGGPSSAAGVVGTSLPSLPSIPTIQVPSAPAVSTTTGASVVIP